VSAKTVVVSAGVSVLCSIVAAGFVTEYVVTTASRRIDAANAEAERRAYNEITGLAGDIGKDIDKLKALHDLHAAVLNNADLGAHWWCWRFSCAREEQMCKAALEATRVLRPDDIPKDESCIPRRMAYCAASGHGMCVPTMDVCIHATGGDECLGVE
jgi:hypothetical protein